MADKEYFEVKVLQELLPTLPTKEDVESYIALHYGGGIDKKIFGDVIREIKREL